MSSKLPRPLSQLSGKLRVLVSDRPALLVDSSSGSVSASPRLVRSVEPMKDWKSTECSVEPIAVWRTRFLACRCSGTSTSTSLLGWLQWNFCHCHSQWGQGIHVVIQICEWSWEDNRLRGHGTLLVDSSCDQAFEQADILHLGALSSVLNVEWPKHVHSCVDEGVLLVYHWEPEFRQVGHLRSHIVCPPSSANETVFPQTSQRLSQPNHQESLLQVSLHMFQALIATVMVRLFNQQPCNSAPDMENEGMFRTVG